MSIFLDSHNLRVVHVWNEGKFLEGFVRMDFTLHGCSLFMFIGCFCFMFIVGRFGQANLKKTPKGNFFFF